MARRARIGRIPYKKMERACKIKREEHPDAAELKPVWSGGKIYVEVWDNDGRAKVELVFDNDEED